MEDALNYIIYIFNSLISLLFNLYIFDNVSIGMVFVVIFIFSVLIRSILNLPSGIVSSMDKKVKNEKRKEFLRELYRRYDW